MKRGLDRDMSPMDKRSRSRYSDRDIMMRDPYDERDRRDRDDGRSQKSSRRERDDYRDRGEFREPRDDYRDRLSYHDSTPSKSRSSYYDRNDYMDRPSKRYRDDYYPEERLPSPSYRDRSPPIYRRGHSSDRGHSYSYDSRPRPRERGHGYRDYRDGDQDPSDYRSLCISKINPRINDNTLRGVLYEEFKGFGENFNVKIVMTATQRIAYINFRAPHEAKYALEKKSNLILFDDPVNIGPVIKGRRDNRKTPPLDLVPQYDDYPPRAPRSSPGGHRPIIKRNDEYEQLPCSDYPPPLPAPYPPNDGYPGEGGGGGGSFNPRKNPPKFPHHLNHIPPEEDPHSTRNLFIGNLDMGITEDDIKESFGQFGQIEDIDIKKPARVAGTAYAFLKFKNLDMAHAAKVALSGTRVGKFNCKIGYGQICPSKCLWVGGLGPWIRPEDLEKEFDRFGVIMSTFWPGGKDYAFILYDDVEAAKAAHDGMRGAPLGGPERRLRTDYVDPEEIPPRGPEGSVPPGTTDQPPPPGFESLEIDPMPVRHKRSPLKDEYPPGEEPPGYEPMAPGTGNGETWHRSHSPEPPVSSPESQSNSRTSSRYQRRSSRRNPDLERIKSAMDLPKHLVKAWHGGMVLKSSAFPTEMHLVEGDRSLAEKLLRDPSAKVGGTLKITQRLRLLQPKLDDLTEKIEAAKVRNQYAILLAVNAPSHVVDNPSNSLQIRPLKNLVTYLESKDSAGVISLPPGGVGKIKDDVGVLHAFPPCAFTKQILVKQAPNILLEPGKDEYLLVVVLKGAA